VLDRESYLARWSETHGGYDPRRSRLVGGYLRAVHALAGPVARRGTSPYALTLLGVALAVLAVLPASGGPGWLVVAALLVAVSGLLDSLDGAVAVLRERATRIGFVVDSVADRVSDGANVAALWVAGADPRVAVAGGGLAFLAEYVRARAGQAGMVEVGVVTVGERPTRVVVTVAFLLAGAALGDPWPGLGAWVWVAVSALSCLQLLVVAARRLR
jgi:CDP-diacylglycerol--glycerol-3-phosphate 3-phosphatidyltransferase